jgi:hypothetical protein
MTNGATRAQLRRHATTWGRPDQALCFRVNIEVLKPSPGGQINRMAASGASVRSLGGQGAASHRPPRGLPHGTPDAGLAGSAAAGIGCCARGAVRSGCARSTGCRTSPSAVKDDGRVVRQSFVRTSTGSTKRREPPMSINAGRRRFWSIAAGRRPAQIRSASTSERSNGYVHEAVAVRVAGGQPAPRSSTRAAVRHRDPAATSRAVMGSSTATSSSSSAGESAL